MPNRTEQSSSIAATSQSNWPPVNFYAFHYAKPFLCVYINPGNLGTKWRNEHLKRRVELTLQRWRFRSWVPDTRLDPRTADRVAADLGRLCAAFLVHFVLEVCDDLALHPVLGRQNRLRRGTLDHVSG